MQFIQEHSAKNVNFFDVLSNRKLLILLLIVHILHATMPGAAAACHEHVGSS